MTLRHPTWTAASDPWPQAKGVSGISKNRTHAIGELKDLLAESQRLEDDLPIKLNTVMVAAESRSHE